MKKITEEKITGFPITSYCEEICNNLQKSDSHVIILTAETAAGKSTVLPLFLMEHFGKILMTEPRRLAVLGVANRLSDLQGEEIGNTVGYKIHLETKFSKNTKLEIVTEGILVNQLQSDPVLNDYNLVIIDEFHERSINTDLVLAFINEALQLRDDLYVVVMSATMNTTKLQNYFGKTGRNALVMKIPGRQFSVEIKYNDQISISQAVKQALKEQNDGNILVFLPGIKELQINQKILQNDLQCFNNIEICILHSSISMEEQKRIVSDVPLNSGDRPLRKIILSSSIAETSLTVPGVTYVIDSGLSRINRMNISTGMENLTTEIESNFSAEQRAGRAGRICSGKCLRLWSEFEPRIKDFPPEILRADITELVLECFQRGALTPDGIDWLDAPNSNAWAESVKLLQNLGFLQNNGNISDKGKIALKLGIHPRLAGIAISGFDGNRINKNACKLLYKYGPYSKSSEEIKRRYILDLEKRLRDSGNVYENYTDLTDLILSGYTDRIAHRTSEIGKTPGEYQFPSGRKALCYEENFPEWIVAPEVMAGKTEGTIFEYEVLKSEQLEKILEKNGEIKEKCEILDGKIQKSEILCLGEIEFSSRKIPVSSEDIILAWCTEIKKKGFGVVPADSRLEKFLIRVEFMNQQKGELVNLEEKICREVDQWLPSFFGNNTKLSSDLVYEALYWYFDGASVDREVPEQIFLPNGRKCKVIYEKQSEIKPIIEIIIQRVFGCFKTPEICGKRVLLRLLSPASRPLQITEDLENFWTGAWPEICKEMKGRYPKHNWDYRIFQNEE